MATVAQVQAQLDSAGTGNIANITQSAIQDGTHTEYYVVAGTSLGRSRYVVCLTGDTAATQATNILAGLRAT